MDTTQTPSQPPMPPESAPPAQPQPKSSMPWMGIVAAVVLIAAAGFGVWWYMQSQAKKPAATTTPKFRIGLSLDTYKELRWAKDRDYMVAHAKSLGGDVTTLAADSDDAKQITQIENLIAQRVDVLVIVAHDAQKVAPTIAEAHAAGIKVIAYDRLIADSDVDAYVTFDSTIIGKYEAKYVTDAMTLTAGKPANIALVGGAETDNNSALVKQGEMGVLQPLVTANKVKIVYDQYTPDWSADVAYTNIKDFLDKGGKLDAVIAANDGTAGGVIKALKTHSLDGKIPVSGSDAELPAVQRVVAGTQTMTIYTPFQNLANEAVDLAYAFYQHKTPTFNGKMNNGKIDVPSFLLDSTPVTKANVQDTIIKPGVYSSTDVNATSSN